MLPIFSCSSRVVRIDFVASIIFLASNCGASSSHSTSSSSSSFLRLTLSRAILTAVIDIGRVVGFDNSRLPELMDSSFSDQIKQLANDFTEWIEFGFIIIIGLERLCKINRQLVKIKFIQNIEQVSLPL